MNFIDAIKHYSLNNEKIIVYSPSLSLFFSVSSDYINPMLPRYEEIGTKAVLAEDWMVLSETECEQRFEKLNLQEKNDDSWNELKLCKN